MQNIIFEQAYFFFMKHSNLKLLILILFSSYTLTAQKIIKLDSVPESKWLYLNASDFQKKIEFLKTNTTIPLYYYWQARYCFEKKEFQKSKAQFQAAIINSKAELDIKIFDTYHFLGINAYYLSQFDSALYYFDLGVKLEKKINYSINSGNALSNMGSIYRILNQPDSATKYFNLALIEFKQNQDTLGLAKVENGLGNLYKTIDNKIAIGHYSNAINYASSMDNDELMAVANMNIGLILIELKSSQAGIEKLKNALTFFKERNDLYHLSIVINNIGFAHLQMRELDKAEQFLFQALDINQNFSDSRAFTFYNLGEMYRLRKSYIKAISFYEEALKYTENKNIELESKIYTSLVQSCAYTGQIDKFSKYFELYNQSLMQIQQKEFSEHLAEYERSLELDKTKLLLKVAEKDKSIVSQYLYQKNIEISFKNRIIILGSLAIVLLLALLYTIYNISKKQKALRKVIAQQKLTVIQHNIELEKTVEERTKELDKALIKAQESDRLKSIFLANISHEFRTPLNSVIGFSDLLAEEEYSTNDVNQYAKIIRTHGYSLLDLINDLIDVSKIESNQMEVKLVKFNYLQLVQQVIGENFEKAKFIDKAHQIDLDFNFCKKQVTLIGDMYKIGLVIEKLVNNAFQNTDFGKIEVGAKRSDNQMIFYVKDTGRGIAQDHLEQIFENFRKFNSNSKKQIRGFGVGLYISRFILSKMNTTLEVSSEENKGSVFSFSIKIDHEN